MTDPKRFTLRFPTKTEKQACKKLAAKAGMSLNNFIVWALRKEVNQAVLLEQESALRQSIVPQQVEA